jgi:uncharacterized membrane protein
MAKKSSKKEVLDLYASAIARKQTKKYEKAHKKTASVKGRVVLSESGEDSSDSDESFHLIRKKRTSSKKTKVQFVSEPDKLDKKKQKPANETTAEEKYFLKHQIAHLESTVESSEKSGSSSDTP